jgi:uncharacterized protein YkwD
MKVLLVLVAFAILQKPEVRIPDLERRVHELINKERKKDKVVALELDEELSRIARAHSEDMAKRKFFAHVNPDKRDASDRGKLVGYICRKVYVGYFTQGLAENIYQGSLYRQIRISGNLRTYEWYSAEEIAEETVEGWMDSPGHRENILTKTYDRAGLGIAIDSDGKVFVTQVFC